MLLDDFSSSHMGHGINCHSKIVVHTKLEAERSGTHYSTREHTKCRGRSKGGIGIGPYSTGLICNLPLCTLYR